MSSTKRNSARRRRQRRARKGNGGGSGGELIPYAVANRGPVGPELVTFNGVFMPAKFRNIMVYSETWNVTTAGGSQAYTYKMNGVYDPYSGAGGNGCYGIDEMQALYGRYRVLSSHIIVTASCQATELTSLYLYPSAESTAATEASAESHPELVTAMLGQYRPVTLDSTSRPSKWLDGAQDRDLASANNGDPPALAYWHLLIKNFSASALNVVMRVRIEFWTEWSQLATNNDVDA